jgi:hypothetical protein
VDATLSGNIYQTKLDGGNVEENLQRTTLGGSSKLLLNVRMPKDFSFQMTGDYNSGWASIMGTMKPTVTFDLGVRKDFFKKQLSVNLSATDIFNGRRMSMEVEGSNYIQEFTRKRESQVLTLNATWKFGRQMEGQGNRKKQRDNQSSPQQEMPDDF